MCRYLNLDRNRSRSFEIRVHARSGDVSVCPFGVDDVVPEIVSGYKCPAPVFADCYRAYQVPFTLSERWDESEDFWGEAVDRCERVLELEYAGGDG